MKQNTYSWIWRWHLIGGLFSFPIVLILSITGGIYLFKDQYEKSEIEEFKHVEIGNRQLSYEQQLTFAQENWDRVPSAMVIPEKSNQATQFISGRFSHKSSIYVDPYSGKITGQQQVSETDMYQVRKLHGELLLGSFGTKIVELTASWMIVLILTGIYLFWPRGGWKGLFRVRFNASRQILFRDLHAVTGFWFSALLLLILAGGLPWTDVFGSGFKKIQNATESGYPDSWQGSAFSSEVNGNIIPLDNLVSKAVELDLVGEVQISPPQTDEAVYTISNETSSLSEMRVYHFDAYSGELLHEGTWNDIGSMMKARLWVMAFHQGEFGFWNWLLVLFTAVALFLLSLFATLSYVRRRSSSGIGVPPVPDNYRIGKGMLLLLIILGVILPMFGMSLIVIFGIRRLFYR